MMNITHPKNNFMLCEVLCVVNGSKENRHEFWKLRLPRTISEIGKKYVLYIFFL